MKKSFFIAGLFIRMVFLFVLVVSCSSSAKNVVDSTPEKVVFATIKNPDEFIAKARQVSSYYFRRYNPVVKEQDETHAIVTAKFGRYDVEVTIRADTTPYQIEVRSNIKDRGYVVKWIRNIELQLNRRL
jgi:uncharacterized protein YcfL